MRPIEFVDSRGAGTLLLCLAMTCWVFGVAFGSGFCPAVCTCKWKSGKQSVECNDKGLIAIPEGIDPETQLLDMSNNNLQVLPKETFVRAQLFNLQKVYLRNCQIGQIDSRALAGLSNVVDLDLSHNLLTSVPSFIFEDLRNLRDLSLAHNPIQKIDAQAFQNASSLIKLDLSQCQISVIAGRAFLGIELLEELRLNGNRLTELKSKTVDTLSLNGIELHDNPWHCDCNLRDLKIWLTEKNVPYPIEPICNGGPFRVFNKGFGQLQANDFACKPEMKVKPENRYVESTAGDNATILCRVDSVPEANISWYWNGRLLHNNTAFSPYQRIVIHHFGDFDKRSVLTLTNAQESDSSQFYCAAENQAGVAEANFTLRVVHRLAGFAVFDSRHVTSISLALLALIVIVLAVVTYLLHRIRKIPTAVRDVKHSSGEECIGNGSVHHASSDDKTLTIEPTLMTAAMSVAAAAAEARKKSTAYTYESQTLPRLNVAAYSPRFEATLGSGPKNHAYHTETSNPDLIADTRYQEDLTQSGGVYTRSDNVFYPSSLWNQNEMHQMLRCSSNTDFRDDTNDRTPIIENVSFYESCQKDTDRPQYRRPFKDCEFPTTSSGLAVETAAATAMTSTTTTTTTAAAGSTASAAYGSPNDAKILRVLQKGVHVLPPVTALKRVLNRNSPDEGYQEGCGTDV